MWCEHLCGVLIVVMCYRFKKKKNTSVYVCVQCVFGQLKSLHPTTFCQCVVVIVVIRYRFKSRGRLLMAMSCFMCVFSQSKSLHPTVLSLKEESSDESTIISSQTSTLTRNQGMCLCTSILKLILKRQGSLCKFFCFVG